jgi:hypothetical protein
VTRTQDKRKIRPLRMRRISWRDLRTFDFVQGDAYVRRFRYLSKLELPPGSLDLGRNMPSKSLTLIAPTVELIARRDPHPALSDLLIEAARELHRYGRVYQGASHPTAPPRPRERPTPRCVGCAPFVLATLLGKWSPGLLEPA